MKKKSMLSCYIVIYTKALLKYCFYLHFYLDRRNEEDKLREEEVKMCCFVFYHKIIHQMTIVTYNYKTKYMNVNEHDTQSHQLKYRSNTLIDITVMIVVCNYSDTNELVPNNVCVA
jgi:hypothetical protein